MMSTSDKDAEKTLQISREALLHVRAFTDFQHVYGAAAKFHDLWDDGRMPEMMQATLFMGMVVTYGRVFADGNHVSQARKSKYPLRDLCKVAGFDMDLHTILINARNKMIAHTDASALPSFWTVHEHSVNGGPMTATRVECWQATLHAVASLALIHRIADQTAICAQFAKDRAGQSIVDYLDRVNNGFPDTLGGEASPVTPTPDENGDTFMSHYYVDEPIKPTGPHHHPDFVYRYQSFSASPPITVLRDAEGREVLMKNAIGPNPNAAEAAWGEDLSAIIAIDPINYRKFPDGF